MATKRKRKLEDTKMHGCKFGCGERFWGDKPGKCPACKAILARIAADGGAARRAKATLVSVGVAYTRGRAMSRNLAGKW